MCPKLKFKNFTLLKRLFISFISVIFILLSPLSQTSAQEGINGKAGMREKISEIRKLLDKGELEKAKEKFLALTQKQKDSLYRVDYNLICKLKRNYVMLKGSYYSYTKGIADEQDYIFEISQKYRAKTIIARYSNIHRFGLTDNQAGIDVYSKLGKKRWGYVSLSGSPDADFLARWTAGGAIFQGYRRFEFSAGYVHMNFKDSSVDIFLPRVITYLPHSLILDERLYIVPKNGTSTLVSTLRYRPDCRFKTFYSFAIGKSAERIGTLQDIEKFNTSSHTLGAEYRVRASLSIGAEIYYSHRQKIYDTQGISIYTRYWW
jgi:YaiO family outer membrane protein